MKRSQLLRQETSDDDVTNQPRQLDDMVAKLHVSRLHAQLRRLKKNSNYSDKIFLTAIPERRSKVSDHNPSAAPRSVTLSEPPSKVTDNPSERRSKVTGQGSGHTLTHVLVYSCC